MFPFLVDPLEVEALAHILVKKKANNPFGNFFNDPFFNDPFFQNAFTSGYQEVKKTLKSNALSINVSALPAGQPEDFCGLVGNLNMEATLDKNEVKANDAVTLTVKISGKGNLNLIDNLNIEFPPDFERKRRLSGLSRAEKDDCGRFVQASGKRRREPSVNHVCNYGIVMYDLHECFGGGRKLSVPSGIRGSRNRPLLPLSLIHIYAPTRPY